MSKKERHSDKLKLHIKNMFISEADKNKAEELRIKGNKLSHRGNVKKAQQKYTEALILDCKNSEVFANRSLTFLTKPHVNIKSAMFDATNAVRLDVANAACWGRLGLTAAYEGKWYFAMHIFNHAKQIAPTCNDTKKKLMWARRHFKRAYPALRYDACLPNELIYLIDNAIETETQNISQELLGKKFTVPNLTSEEARLVQQAYLANERRSYVVERNSKKQIYELMLLFESDQKVAKLRIMDECPFWTISFTSNRYFREFKQPHVELSIAKFGMINLLAIQTFPGLPTQYEVIQIIKIAMLKNCSKPLRIRFANRLKYVYTSVAIELRRYGISSELESRAEADHEARKNNNHTEGLNYLCSTT